MKYSIGQTLLLKKIRWKARPWMGEPTHLRIGENAHKDTFAVVVDAQYHRNGHWDPTYWPTDKDNIYVVYSQSHNREFFFFEDEVESEVIS